MFGSRFQLCKIFFISVCLTSAACYQNVKKPADLVDTNEFSQILRDVYTLQGLVDKQIADPDLKSLYFETYKVKVLEHYGIDTTTFQQNYTFYQHQLDTFLAIHDRIIRDYNDMIYGSKE